MAAYNERVKRIYDEGGVTFGDALKRLRIKMGWSHRVLADAVGESVDFIKKLEANTEIPKGRVLARLKGCVEGISPYLILIRANRLSDSIIDAVNQQGTLKLPEAPVIDYSTFGSALKGLRMDSGLELSDVASLVGPDVDFIADIEEGRRDTMFLETYDKFISLFEPLKDVPKPTILPMPPNLRPVPPSPSAIMPSMSPPTTSEEAAMKWSRLLVRKSKLAAHLKNLEAEIIEVKKELEQVAQDAVLAHAAVEDAARREAGG